MTETSPAALGVELKEAARRMQERIMANETKDPNLQGKRAYVEGIVKTLKRKGLTAHKKGCLRAARLWYIS